MEDNIGPMDAIDSVAKVLPPCMRAIVATANLLQHERDNNGLSTDSLCAPFSGSLT